MTKPAESNFRFKQLRSVEGSNSASLKEAQLLTLPVVLMRSQGFKPDSLDYRMATKIDLAAVVGHK